MKILQEGGGDPDDPVDSDLQITSLWFGVANNWVQEVCSIADLIIDPDPVIDSDGYIDGLVNVHGIIPITDIDVIEIRLDMSIPYDQTYLPGNAGIFWSANKSNCALILLKYSNATTEENITPYFTTEFAEIYQIPKVDMTALIVDDDYNETLSEEIFNGMPLVTSGGYDEPDYDIPKRAYEEMVTNGAYEFAGLYIDVEIRISLGDDPADIPATETLTEEQVANLTIMTKRFLVNVRGVGQ